MKLNNLKKYTIKYWNETLKASDEYISSFFKREIEFEKMEKFQTLKIVNNSKKVISNFLSKDMCIFDGRIGLLIGQVQSGKTKTFLGVISSAFDHGYDVVILLAGSDNGLKNQTVKRLKDTFIGNKYFPERIKIDEATSSKKVEQIKRQLNSELLKKRKIKYIIPTLKNRVWLDRILKVFSDLDKKVLIIDDEGDQASLNSESKTKDNSSLEEATAINKILRKILNSPSDMSYLTVTATPYANIIQNKENDMTPDFAIVAEPGEGYMGLSYFHNGEYPYINEIPADSLNNIDSLINDIYSRAIPAFVIGNSFLRITNDIKSKKDFEMIIHVARKIVNNEEVENKLKYKIEKLCKYSSNAIDDYDYNQEFIKSFINKGLDINNLEWVISDVALYKKLIENIKEFLPELSIKHQYSKTKDENDDSVGDKIIVGSNLIERGVTFNELRLTYMGFLSKEPQADTIIQRARWFGYRDATEMQTVFLPKELITKYEESNFAQKELYEKLATNEGLTEVIDDGFASPFNPTRKTVNISATYGDIDTFSSRQRKIRDDVTSLFSGVDYSLLPSIDLNLV